ncbi:MAG: guanylate kinase [Myxococcota bacterium]
MTSRCHDRGIPFVVAAPSGTGKTTVCRKILAVDDAVVFSISHTTRPPRVGEVNGSDYHFVSEDEFKRMVEADAFLEWAVYNGHHYGTSWRSIDVPLEDGRDVLLEIEVQGARQVRQRRSDARFIFLMPPSTTVLEERLAGRGTDSREQVQRRLELARRELTAVGDFDYAVVNDDLDRCVAGVVRIIAAERAGETAEVRQRFAPEAPA